MNKFICEIFNNDSILMQVNDIVSISFSALDRGDLKNFIDFGVYANRGDISFFDKDSKFYDIITPTTDNLSNLYVKFYFCNKSENVKKQLAVFKIQNYDYSKETKKATIQLIDGLLDLQLNKKVKYFSIDTLSLKEISEGLVWLGFLPDKTIIDPRNFTEDTKIFVPKIDATSSWDAINQICLAGMLRAYSNEDGNLIFTRDEPKSNYKPIIIEPKNILKIGSKVSRIETRIPNFKLSVKKIDKNSVGENSSIVAGSYLHNLDISNIVWYNINKTYKSEDDKYTYSIQQARNEDNSYIFNFLNSDTAGNPSLPDIQTIKTIENVEDNIFSVIEKPYITVLAKYLYPDGTEEEIPYYNSSGDNRTYYIKTSFDSNNRKVNVLFRTSDVLMTATDYIRCYHSSLLNVVGLGYYDRGSFEEGYRNDENSDYVSLQDSTMFQFGDYNGETKYYEKIVEYIKNRYSKGLECCEMECHFSNYYYQDGNLAINKESTTKENLCFSKYDIVIPYIIENGEKKPYSVDSNGNAKKFIIIGIKYSYKGLPKQTLVLQEYPI